MGIKKSVKDSATISITPTFFVSGPTKILVGPFTLPPAPGGVMLKGTLKLTMSEAAALGEGAGDDACTTPRPNHLTNLQYTVSGDTTTTKFTLDEDVTKLSVSVDITLQELFIKIPLKLDVPVSFTPGVTKNDYTIVTTDSGPQLSSSERLGLTAKGEVKMNDQNGEQVFCAVIDSKTAGANKTIAENQFLF